MALSDTTYRTVHTHEGRVTLETQVYEDGVFTVVALDEQGEEIGGSSGDLADSGLTAWEYIRGVEDDLIGLLDL